MNEDGPPSPFGRVKDGFGPRSNRVRKRLKIQAIMTYIRKLDKTTLNLYTRDHCRSCRASAQGSPPGDAREKSVSGGAANGKRFEEAKGL